MLARFFYKYFFISVAVIFQIALNVVMILFFKQYFFVYRVVMSVITFFVFMWLCNKNTNPQILFPWYFLFLFFPVVGIVMWIMLAKSFKEREYECCEKIVDKKAIDNSIISDISNILNAAKHQSDIKYFNCGKKLFKYLINDIKNAKNYVFLEFFIVKEGKLLNSILELLKAKSKQGVKVYFIFDDIGSRISKKTLRKMRDADINVQAFCGSKKFSLIHNNRDHRKICVIDGEIAYTGGVNIADEYVGEIERFGVWKDCGVKITGSGVADFVGEFVYTYNIGASQKIDHSQFKTTNVCEDGGQSVNVFSCPKQCCNLSAGENTILTLIESATKSVDIMTPYFVVDYWILNLLSRVQAKGVKIRIFLPGIPDKKTVNIITKSNYEFLLKNGIEIYEYDKGFLHSKVILIDEKTAFVGTINFDYRSFNHHYECGVITSNVNTVEEIKADFLELKKECSKINLGDTVLTNFERLAQMLIKIFAPLM